MTIMERHPDYPRGTTKFMGCGRCVERHFNIKPVKPLGGSHADEILRHIRATLDDCIVVVSDKKMSSGTVSNDNDAASTTTGRVPFASEEEQVQESERIRRSAMETKGQLLIDVLDVRGLGVQCSALNTNIRKSHSSGSLAVGANATGTSMRQKKSTGSHSTAVQISLTAAFDRARELQDNKQERKKRLDATRTKSGAGGSGGLPRSRKRTDANNNNDTAILLDDSDDDDAEADVDDVYDIVDLVRQSTTELLAEEDNSAVIVEEVAMDATPIVVGGATTGGAATCLVLSASQPEVGDSFRIPPANYSLERVDALAGAICRPFLLHQHASSQRSASVSVTAVEAAVDGLAQLAVACMSDHQDLLAARNVLRRTAHILAENTIRSATIGGAPTQRGVLAAAKSRELLDSAHRRVFPQIFGPSAAGATLALEL